MMKILEWPHPTLRSKARPVVDFNDELDQLIDQMWNTLYESVGVALAAPQVDLPIRVFLMDCSEHIDHSQPLVCVNPQILSSSGEIDFEEGCLSFPGLRLIVPRAASIHLRYQDQKGQHCEHYFENLEAICVQHELDHLDGKSFLDHLSPLEYKATLHEYIRRLKLSPQSDSIMEAIECTFKLLDDL